MVTRGRPRGSKNKARGTVPSSKRDVKEIHANAVEQIPTHLSIKQKSLNNPTKKITRSKKVLSAYEELIHKYGEHLPANPDFLNFLLFHEEASSLQPSVAIERFKSLMFDGTKTGLIDKNKWNDVSETSVEENNTEIKANV